MKIKTKMIIYSATILLSFLGINLNIMLRNMETGNAERNYRYTESLLKTSMGIETLSYDYLLTLSERSKSQWMILHDELNNLIKNMKCKKTENISLINKIRTDNGQLLNIFRNILKAHQEANSNINTSKIKLLNVLSNELKVKIQFIVNNASQLKNNIQEFLQTAKENNESIFYLSTAVYVVIGIIFSLILSNQIIYSLNKLKEGIDIISKGNLEHKIKIKTKDEVADFLNKFNNMTSMLKTTLESKKKAYEEIRIINRNLELIVEERTQELNNTNSQLIDKNNELQELNIQLEKNIEDRQIAFEELERMNEEFERTNVELETANAKLIDTNLERDKAYKSLLKKNNELEQMNIELQKANKEREIAYEANERLEEMNKKLETAYKYTAELKNKLEASNKYKSAFISNISHELRTPLNSIILLSELLMEDYSDCRDNFSDKCMRQSPENAKRAEIIYHSGNDLLELINDILDLSKIEAGKMNIHTDEFNLFQFITEINERFIHLSKDKNIIFESVNELENDPYIKTDKGKLAQILKNFISNAFKFTEKGEVKIILSYSNNPEKPYMITVKDTGIGIKEDEQKLIFESFIQLDYSNIRKFKGTGLGLPISKQLANLLNGYILVNSIYGKGSSFSIILPEEISDSEISLEQFDSNKNHIPVENPYISITKDDKSEETTFKDKSSLLKGKRILYAEVDPIEMFSYTSILEAHEAETIMVYDSNNVFQVLNNENVDIIIIDMAFTGNAGFDITKRIREHPKYKNTSIIISSKEGNDEYQYKFDQLNVDLYIKKPISPKDFIDSILSLANYQ